jgi:hypothetical protein
VLGDLGDQSGGVLDRIPIRSWSAVKNNASCIIAWPADRVAKAREVHTCRTGCELSTLKLKLKPSTVAPGCLLNLEEGPRICFSTSVRWLRPFSHFAILITLSARHQRTISARVRHDRRQVSLPWSIRRWRTIAITIHEKRLSKSNSSDASRGLPKSFQCPSPSASRGRLQDASAEL